MELNDLTREIIGGAIAVHKQLGPGMLESAYEECLIVTVVRNGIKRYIL